MTAHQHRLTAAREAVAEAAKKHDAALDAISLYGEDARDDAVRTKARLQAAVAHLLEVEKEHG